MGITATQWLLAFVAAIVLHALAGGLILLAENTAPPPQQTAEGVFVSLDSLTTGGPPQLSATPEPITAAAPPTPVSQPAAATTPDIPAAATTPVAAPAAATPPLATPQPVAPPQPTVGGAIANAGSAKIPVANAVTIQAADTLQALEQTTAIQATAPSLPATEQTGSGANGDSTDPTKSYIGRISAWITRHKYYPQVARASGAQGIVKLYLVVDRDGNVQVSIAKSSGNPALDQAAKDMVKRSKPLPPMTENMLRTRLEIILPVHYTLSVTPDAVVATPQ